MKMDFTENFEEFCEMSSDQKLITLYGMCLTQDAQIRALLDVIKIIRQAEKKKPEVINKCYNYFMEMRINDIIDSKVIKEHLNQIIGRSLDEIDGIHLSNEEEENI